MWNKLAGILISLWVPLLGWQTSQSIKAGQSRLLGPFAIILFALASQIAMVGAAIPTLFVSSYAYVLYNRVSDNAGLLLPMISLSSCMVNHLKRRRMGK